jgi:hypothetical protein
MWVSTDMPYCLDYPNQVRRPAFPFGAFPGSDEYRLWSFVTMSAMDLPKYLRKTVFGDKCIQLDSECCDASAARIGLLGRDCRLVMRLAARTSRII